MIVEKRESIFSLLGEINSHSPGYRSILDAQPNSIDSMLPPALELVTLLLPCVVRECLPRSYLIRKCSISNEETV
jgi:hypothetical protein